MAVYGQKLSEKVNKSILRLKTFEPPEGYYLAFSGGKDSCVLKWLADTAGVKYHAVYRITSVDPPELVTFIKEKHPDVKLDPPYDKDGKRITMWNLIPKKLMPPTRLVRYCCASLKESGGDGEMTLTGVRWAESVNRKQNQGIATVRGKKEAMETLSQDSFFVNKAGGVVLVNDNDESRSLLENCYKRHKTTVNPIVDWDDDDVWDYIRAEKIPYCGLYDCGFRRLGCIGCPMASRSDRLRQFAMWPKYKAAYLRAFQKMIDARKERGLIDGAWRMGTTPQQVFNWWTEDKNILGQQAMEGFEDYDYEDEYD